MGWWQVPAEDCEREFLSPIRSAGDHFGPPTGCGNGVVTAGEGCDDGNVVAGDGCSPICAPEGACGDGVIGPFEQCDDGNLNNADGCDSNCTLTGCGNGIVTGTEQCDQGAANGLDFCCSVTCHAVDSDLDGICDEVDVCPSVSDVAQTNTDGDVFGDACDICPGDADNDSDDDGFCFELNAEAFPRGGTPGRDQCGEVAFSLAPAKPACIFKPGLLNCK